MRYFSNYDWDREIFKQFLKIHIKRGASIVYDEDNIVIVNITTFRACHMLLGNGEMHQLCYATHPVFWSFYFNRPNSKLIAIFNFNLPRKDEKSLYAISSGFAKELYVLNRAHHYYHLHTSDSSTFKLHGLYVLETFVGCNTTKHISIQADYGVCAVFEDILWYHPTNISPMRKQALNEWFKSEIIDKKKYHGFIFNIA